MQFLATSLTAFGLAASALAEPVFVEAESFGRPGGWQLDTQFIEIMGSPYLLAHGLGRPVEDAVTTISIPQAGDYHVFVRTKDWVAPWKAPGAPGKFQLLVNGQALPETLGASGAEWHWQAAGSLQLAAGEVQLALHDLTGFDGRCDAIVFTTAQGSSLPNGGPDLVAFRRKCQRLPEVPPETEEYHLVVIGGGYSGVAAALSAARQGLKVALVQNRPVLGGNGSSEIRVWAQGGTRRGLYPRIGEIVEEFADHAKNSPGTKAEYGDQLKEETVRKEKGIDLYLNHHVIAVAMQKGERKAIQTVTALDTKTGEEKRFRGQFFADCTGHGTVGALAGASFTMKESGHMGMSNMWFWQNAEAPVEFPKLEWALPLALGDFPITKAAEGQPFHKGEWFWESGFDKHPLKDLELVRDWNLRAVFGAFNAMKNGPEADKFAKARLDWVACIGGTRESRLLEGDIILTEKDIVDRKPFPDGCVPTTWDLDLHYPKEQYAKKFPDAPFISKAVFGKGVDRREGYPLPYRCFYSKDVENLFMAGRCISVTHEALGTVRVMRTCGMMGEVVGKAAYLCVANQSTPRGIYQSHLDELKQLWGLPGAARRAKIGGPVEIPKDLPVLGPSPGDRGRVMGLDPKSFGGVVIDDEQAVLTGKWTQGTGLKGFVGIGYRYSTGSAAEAEARFQFTVPKSAKYEVRIAWQPHENRAAAVPCSIETGSSTEMVTLNQKQAPAMEKGFTSVGTFPFLAGKSCSVVLSAKGVTGNVHADAVWLVEVK